MNLTCQELKCLSELSFLESFLHRCPTECWQTNFHIKNLHDLYHEW